MPLAGRRSECQGEPIAEYRVVVDLTTEMGCADVLRP